MDVAPIYLSKEDIRAFILAIIVCFILVGGLTVLVKNQDSGILTGRIVALENSDKDNYYKAELDGIKANLKDMETQLKELDSRSRLTDSQLKQHRHSWGKVVFNGR